MKSNANDNLADRLYQDFCETEGGINHPVSDAWFECEKAFGDIKISSPIDNLFREAIRYAVDALNASNDDCY